jgi:hypothetical protein
MPKPVPQDEERHSLFRRDMARRKEAASGHILQGGR